MPDLQQLVTALPAMSPEAARMLREVVAERDFLRNHVETLRVAMNGLERMLADETAERARLRAVVDAAIEVRRLRGASREVDEPADWDDEDQVREMSRRLASATVATSDALDLLSDRLDQLDDMGGSDE